jgi:NAD(P) transhydrogenase subunit alpha
VRPEVLDHEDVLICGDHGDAKAAVVELAATVTGKPGIDAGALRLARQLEPLTAVLISVNKRYKGRSGIAVVGLDGHAWANIAGHRAVIEAAHNFGGFFTGQVTAAGKVPPAKVLVCGAGAAGLAAIGAAGSLGAIVRATDPRPEVADQVRSLGGEYLSIESPEVEVSATGYANDMGGDYKQREAELYADQAADVDIIITTALIPGRPAPRLITAEMVASMRPGSVIVDMAAQNGGTSRARSRSRSR